MTQTRFVLKKALEHGLRPVVVINKADRDTARVGGEVENEVRWLSPTWHLLTCIFFCADFRLVRQFGRY